MARRDGRGTRPVVSNGWQPSALEQDRMAYRRRQATRSTVIAVVSSVVVVVGLSLGIVSTPGWSRVKETFFDPARALDALPAVATGLWLNIRVMLVCGVLIAIFGLFVAVLRTLRGPIFFPLRVFAAAYTDLFRGRCS